jgi:tRNA threonylcarbamoyladenosine biosynthesis protein TsaE
MNIVSHSVKQTITIGRMIAGNLAKGDIVCLFGSLGAGKTVLVKGIAEGLGIKKREIISPTFVLLQEHRGRVPFYHFDLYRLTNPKDILDLGYEDYLYDDAVTVIEWADRLKYLLPKECLSVELVIKGAVLRLLRISAAGSRYKQLLSLLEREK